MARPSAEERHGEIGAAARGGLISLVGAAASALFGFALVVLLARLLGVASSGVVLQAVAVFMIAVAVVRLGMDTVAMWLLPRLRVTDPTAIPAALTALLVPAVVVPVAVVLGWFGLLALRDDPVLGAAVDEAVSATAWFLPVASLMIVAVTASRAFGSVLPFNLIQNIAVPGGRLVVIAVAVWLGGAAVASSIAWAAVYLPAAAVSVVILLRGARRQHPHGPLLARPDRALVKEVARFGLPRTVSAAAEQANLWLALVLVGLLLDARAAGAYGSAARFVAAGLIVSTATRVAVAPRFSALLAKGQNAAVGELYSITARWVLLFGAPIYVALAVNAPTVLRGLGEGFDDAAVSMAILCLGATVTLAAGNVQSLLLMSGGSGWAAVNRLIAVAVMVVGTLLLVPELGMEGAAVAWGVGAAVDVVLAVVQVRRRTGISLDLLPTIGVLAVVAIAVGGPGLLATSLIGQGWLALCVGLAGGGVGLAIAAWLLRKPLHLGEIAAIFRPGAARSETRSADSGEQTTVGG